MQDNSRGETSITSPLAQRRVLVTRAAHQVGKLSEALRVLGAEPVEVPVLQICPPDDSYHALDVALEQMPRYDWLILTSANSVRAIAERAAILQVDLSQCSPCKVAAIGPATAREAENAGLTITLTPDTYVAESLVQKFADSMGGKRILIVRAAVARDVIPNALRDLGASVDVVEAYRNVLPEDTPEKLRQALQTKIDAVTFTSSSSVNHLRGAAQKAGLAWPFASIPAVSIGPITSETLRESGWIPAIEANPSDVPNLIHAVVKILSR